MQYTWVQLTLGSSRIGDLARIAPAAQAESLMRLREDSEPQGEREDQSAAGDCIL
jgi:hypothetical protein